MESIYTYINYRTFLADYYTFRKGENHRFSYQVFSKMIGFKSKSSIYKVIKGKTNLKETSITKLCQALNFSINQVTYFGRLVKFNQARNLKERTFYFIKMTEVPTNLKEAGNAKLIRKDQYDYYANWYHVVIRSIIDLKKFKNNYAELAKIVYPPITKLKAKKSVSLLLRLGFIKKKKDGYYKINDKTITTGAEIESIRIQQFHVEMLEKAKQAIIKLPKDKRNISGLTLGISSIAYKEIVELIDQTRNMISEIARNDKGSDRIYQLNFLFIPLSKIIKF